MQPSRSGTIVNPWFARHIGVTPPRCRLFCFPYAGGGASVYRNWANDLAAPVEVCAIQLPGREWRHSEPPIRRVAHALDLLLPVLRPYLDLPFAFFGHSMGALLAYEIARRLSATRGPMPHCLFVSGHRAPHLPPRQRLWHTLPEDELVAKLKTLNGTPSEVFEHQDLLDLVLPIVRADLELVETYVALPGARLTCKLVALAGDADPDVPEPELQAWQTVTDGDFKAIVFGGDHFYLNTARRSVLQTVRQEMAAAGLL